MRTNIILLALIAISSIGCKAFSNAAKSTNLVCVAIPAIHPKSTCVPVYEGVGSNAMYSGVVTMATGEVDYCVLTTDNIRCPCVNDCPKEPQLAPQPAPQMSQPAPVQAQPAPPAAAPAPVAPAPPAEQAKPHK